jgi:hypothetical protein
LVSNGSIVMADIFHYPRSSPMAIPTVGVKVSKAGCVVPRQPELFDSVHGSCSPKTLTSPG